MNLDYQSNNTLVVLLIIRLPVLTQEPRIEAWNPMQRIGDVFLSITDYMKVLIFESM
jgi:hypothetical protein